MKFSRVWAMPSADTFDIAPIREFVDSYLSTAKVSVDPFARNKRLATYTNDLNPATNAEHHLEARVFLAMLVERGVRADVLIFDPPYSPRQISECYTAAGLRAGMADTQNAKLVKECRALMRQIATEHAVCLSFGWNSAGMGKGWDTEEIMLVAHGGAHNDTICMAQRRCAELQSTFKLERYDLPQLATTGELYSKSAITRHNRRVVKRSLSTRPRLFTGE